MIHFRRFQCQWLRTVSYFRLIATLLALTAGGCDNLRRAAEELLDHRPPRQRYVDALANAGLGSTALATDWTAAGDRALREAPLVTSPYEEQGYLAPGEPVAIALRIQVRRGQEVTLAMDLPGDTTTTLFLDAWASTARFRARAEPSRLRRLR